MGWCNVYWKAEWNSYNIHLVWYWFDGMSNTYFHGVMQRILKSRMKQLQYPLGLILVWWYVKYLFPWGDAIYTEKQNETATISTWFDIGLMVCQIPISMGDAIYTEKQNETVHWKAEWNSYNIHLVWYWFDGMSNTYFHGVMQYTLKSRMKQLQYPLGLILVWWYVKYLFPWGDAIYTEKQNETATISTWFDIGLMVCQIPISMGWCNIHWKAEWNSYMVYPLGLILVWWYVKYLFPWGDAIYTEKQNETATISTWFDIGLMVCQIPISMGWCNIHWKAEWNSYNIHLVWYWFDGMSNTYFHGVMQYTLKSRMKQLQYPLGLTLVWWYGK